MEFAIDDVVSIGPNLKIVAPNEGPMRRALERARCFAASNSPVLLDGKSGTGKELVAEAIHRMSPRANKPYVAINCGAIPDTLAEAELFGRTRGAYTGADSMTAGFFGRANGGTLFLDEVQYLTRQPTLLRIIQSGELQRPGSDSPTKVDVRIIVAASTPLDELVQSGKFLEPLYFRLKDLRIRLPELAERRTDIPALARFFLNDTRISEDALELLAQYTWKGNVRELKGTLETASLLAGGRAITASTLMQILDDQLTTSTALATRLPICLETCTLDEFESAARAFITERRLLQCGGNKSVAAASLGINRTTLYKSRRKRRERAAA